MAILVVIMYVALSACMESQPTSAPLSQLAVYEWIGTGPPPLLLRLAQDKLTCFHESERTDTQKDPGMVSEQMVANTTGVNGAPWSESAHKMWSLVRSRWNMDDVRLHDLRRTCASYLAIQERTCL